MAITVLGEASWGLRCGLDAFVVPRIVSRKVDCHLRLV
jgi:hypothetical protein